MTNGTYSYNVNSQISSVTACADSNIAGSYYNGTLNNGVGATFTVASASLTIDDVVLQEGDRVLLFGQSDDVQNGIYDVFEMNGVSVVLKRSSDFQTSNNMTPGFFTTINSGTIYKGSMSVVVAPKVTNIGFEGIFFVTTNEGNSSQIVFNNDALKVYDLADTTYYLTWKPNSELTFPRTFTLVTGDSDRTLTLSANIELDQDVSASATPSFSLMSSNSISIANLGLRILQSTSSNYLTLNCNESLTANRTLKINIDYTNKILSLNNDFTVEAYGATLLDTSTDIEAMNLLGIKAGVSPTWGGGGTVQTFITPGVLATDSVQATLLGSSVYVKILSVVPDLNQITITFSADPGAGTFFNYVAIEA